MFLKVKKWVSKKILSLLDKKILINLIEQEKINSCYSYVVAGRGTTFYPGAKIENLQNDKSKIFLGTNTHIRGNLLIWPYGDGIQIGNNSYVGENSIIRAGEQIIIGNNVLIAHNVTIIDSDSHELDYLEREISFIKLTKYGHPLHKGLILTARIIIEDNAWISYNSCILKGVTIGKGAIIAAGSVVIKDIPSFVLAAGNPARVIKQLN